MGMQWEETNSKSVELERREQQQQWPISRNLFSLSLSQQESKDDGNYLMMMEWEMERCIWGDGMWDVGFGSIYRQRRENKIRQL